MFITAEQSDYIYQFMDLCVAQKMTARRFCPSKAQILSVPNGADDLDYMIYLLWVESTGIEPKKKLIDEKPEETEYRQRREFLRNYIKSNIVFLDNEGRPM